ncbi:MAG: hydroxymethylbilane synthase [Deltaproteobacteria bacterium]|uniref:Porphobilinogen deaminase n=1 Tax=Candidatus Zymogenus saltonus TaxID=2844893 RepID=A0A9D8KDF9_9DELT|nr:hydroxymethylbilane synthase [Candidatus Zymogenus saltonus]
MKKIRIGTRGSRLALAQANTVAGMLKGALGCDTEIVTIKTAGDSVNNVPLWKVGGKGLFVKEIETALLKGEIDIAVHSMKDLPAEISEGLVVGAVPRRLNPEDCLIVSRRVGDSPPSIGGIGDLPEGAVVGTSSLRRGAQLLMIRPDLRVIPMRGNVDTRLKKLGQGECDATVLAAAGMDRLGLDDVERVHLNPAEFIPAVGQGALAVEVGRRFREEVSSIDDAESRAAVLAERALVRTLGATCRSAVGGYARIVDGRLMLKGRVLSPDGRDMLEGEASGEMEDGAEIGRELGEELLGRGAGRLLDMAPEG